MSEPLKCVHYPKGHPHFDGLSSASMSDQIVIALDKRLGPFSGTDGKYPNLNARLQPSFSRVAIRHRGKWRTVCLNTIYVLSAPRNEEALRMREVLASQEGKARYALRKSTVEPVFGQIKEARGIRRFRLRGLLKVTSEWKLICATHNLLKLFRHRTVKPMPEPGSASFMPLLHSFSGAFRLTSCENEMLACS
jgi:hypothetical protein